MVHHCLLALRCWVRHLLSLGIWINCCQVSPIRILWCLPRWCLVLEVLVLLNVGDSAILLLYYNVNVKEDGVGQLVGQVVEFGKWLVDG
ncbi:hypothetical protein TSUD_86150 [Trifolium subterraneum]|uniref:Uncharacterized protein n=1 Tax=Trifolium subterraneum TaxID=3900 RepID=A0A2Z6PFM2_TRISU|nr:hypothetical protein TSUD_86150 [Trifolium subterraneum]